MEIALKFKITQKLETESGYEVKGQVVTSTSPENEVYFKYTPWGNINFGLLKKETADKFKVGEEYVVKVQIPIEEKES